MFTLDNNKPTQSTQIAVDEGSTGASLKFYVQIIETQVELVALSSADHVLCEVLAKSYRHMFGRPLTKQ